MEFNCIYTKTHHDAFFTLIIIVNSLLVKNLLPGIDKTKSKLTLGQFITTLNDQARIHKVLFLISF